MCVEPRFEITERDTVKYILNLGEKWLSKMKNTFFFFITIFPISRCSSWNAVINRNRLH